ncbi:MAG: hypothetical protein ABSC94_04555 [Polyangiaceae bacterium]
MSATDPERRSTLDQAAADVAAAWVNVWIGDLRVEGRRIAGGWPGTLREVRGLVRSELATRRLTPASFEELESVARTAYAIARRSWLACAEQEDETPEASP